MQFTTNYAGALPRRDKLRRSSGRQSSGSIPAWHPRSRFDTVVLAPAQSFELFRPAGNGALLRVRDVFAAYREGSVELTFSCNSANFDAEKPRFTQLLNSFRSLPKDVKTNP